MVGKIPPPHLQGGIKPGMDNLPFHILSNSISIISPPLQGGIKPGMDNLPFHVLSNSIRSYQDNEGMMMKGCVKWNTVYD